MAKGKAQIRARGGFTPGTKVALIERYGDRPRLAGADIIDTATVDKSGEVRFTGLPEGQRYWIVSQDEERRGLAATSKLPEEGKDRISDAKVRQRLAQTTAPRRREQGNVVLNPETKTKTVVLTAAGQPYDSDKIGVETPAGEREQEPQPRLRQEDARHVAQRSATLTGGAYPVEAGEPQPQPRQEDFQNVAQRSATPLGAATPLDPKPETQEDARKLKQRSATEVGVAEVKPKGDGIHQALTRDASVKQASGVSGSEHSVPEPADRASEQRKAKPTSRPRKASAASSETRQQAKRDGSRTRAIRRESKDESDN